MVTDARYFTPNVSDDGSLKIWDAETGAERLTLSGQTFDAETGAEHLTLSGQVWDCAVSPAGDWIVSASNDKTLKIWDVLTGVERLTLKDHTGGVTSCAVSPTGDWIISTSTDQKLKLWDAQTGVCLATLIVDDKLWACAFCPDGTHLVAGGESGIYFLRIIE